MGDRVLVSGVWVHGPLAHHAVGFAAFLSGQGYTMGRQGCRRISWPSSVAGLLLKVWMSPG
jgi:hypothetical protein